jgi:hypothetical protein
VVPGPVTEGLSECCDRFVQCGVDTGEVVGESACSDSDYLVSLACGGLAFEYDRAASSVTDDQAVTFECPIGAHDGVLRESEIRGELTNRWQLMARDQYSATDLPVELAA